MVRIPTYERGRPITATQTSAIRATPGMFDTGASARAAAGQAVASAFSSLGAALGQQQADNDRLAAGVEMSSFEASLQKEMFRVLSETDPKESANLGDKFFPFFDATAAQAMQRIPSPLQGRAAAQISILRNRYDQRLTQESLKRGFEAAEHFLNEQAANEAAGLYDNPEGMDDAVRRLRALGAQTRLPRWRAEEIFEKSYIELIKAGQQGYLKRNDLEGADEFVKKYIHLAPVLGIDTQIPGSAPLVPVEPETHGGRPGSSPRALLSPHDRDDVIRTIHVEARASAAGRESVAHVIRNRVVSGRYPRTAGEVVRQAGQFTGRQLHPDRMASIGPGHPSYEAIGQIVDRVFAGEVKDITKGATHFYSPSGMARYVQEGLAASETPPWARGSPRLANIGGHYFHAPHGRVGIVETTAEPEPARSIMTFGQDSVRVLSEIDPAAPEVLRAIAAPPSQEPAPPPQEPGLPAPDRTDRVVVTDVPARAPDAGQLRVTGLRGAAVDRASRWNTIMRGLEAERNKAAARIRAEQEGERRLLQSDMEGNIVAAQEGLPEKPDIIERAARLLQPESIELYQRQIEAARHYGAVMTGFESLSPEERSRALQRLYPVDGGGDLPFRLKLYQQGVARANKIDEQDARTAKEYADEILKRAYVSRRSGEMSREAIEQLIPYATPAEMRELLKYRPQPRYDQVRSFIHEKLSPRNFPFAQGLLTAELASAQRNALQEYDLWERQFPDADLTEHMIMAEGIFRRHAGALLQSGQTRASIGLVPYFGSIDLAAVTMDHVQAARSRLAEDTLAGRVSRELATHYYFRLQEWEKLLTMTPPLQGAPGGARPQQRSGSSFLPPSKEGAQDEAQRPAGAPAALPGTSQEAPRNDAPAATPADPGPIPSPGPLPFLGGLSLIPLISRYLQDRNANSRRP